MKRARPSSGMVVYFRPSDRRCAWQLRTALTWKAQNNIAVNDEIVLHAVAQREVRDGDVVEIIPSMSGG